MTPPTKKIHTFRVDLDITATIMEQALNAEANFTPAQIYSYLKSTEEFNGRLPSIRTVQRMVKEFRGAEPSPSSHWSDYPWEEARVLLDVLRAVDAPHWQYSGQIRTLTKEEADWVVKISKAAQGLQPKLVFELARTYVVWHRLGLSTTWIDSFLVMTPWNDKRSLENYLEPGQEHWIQEIITGGSFSIVLRQIFIDLGADINRWMKTGKVSSGKD